MRYAQPIRLSLEENWVPVSLLAAVVYTLLAMGSVVYECFTWQGDIRVRLGYQLVGCIYTLI